MIVFQGSGSEHPRSFQPEMSSPVCRAVWKHLIVSSPCAVLKILPEPTVGSNGCSFILCCLTVFFKGLCIKERKLKHHSGTFSVGDGTQDFCFPALQSCTVPPLGCSFCMACAYTWGDLKWCDFYQTSMWGGVGRTQPTSLVSQQVFTEPRAAFQGSNSVTGASP